MRSILSKIIQIDKYFYYSDEQFLQHLKVFNPTWAKAWVVSRLDDKMKEVWFQGYIETRSEELDECIEVYKDTEMHEVLKGVRDIAEHYLGPYRSGWYYNNDDTYRKIVKELDPLNDKYLQLSHVVDEMYRRILAEDRFNIKVEVLQTALSVNFDDIYIFSQDEEGVVKEVSQSFEDIACFVKDYDRVFVAAGCSEPVAGEEFIAGSFVVGVTD